MFRKAVFLFFFLICCRVVYAGSILGEVTESVQGKDVYEKVQSAHKVTRAVAGAQVSIEGQDQMTYTDSSGNFRLNHLPDGIYNIAVVKEGYHLSTKQVRVQGITPSHVNFNLIRRQNAPSLNMGAYPSTAVPNSVYIAFSAISEMTNAPGIQGGSPVVGGKMTMNTSIAAVAAGANPETIGLVPSLPKNTLDQGSKDYVTPTGARANNITILDPHVPKNTSFIDFNAKPFWVCFDNTGSRLFVSTDTNYIAVMDANAGNRFIGSIPANGIVTDMKRAPDGNVYVTVSGSRPGVMVISPATNTTAAFYPVRAMKISSDAQPRALAVGSDYIYVAMASTSAGEVLALNRSGGAVLGSCPVGAFPQGICVTPNGKYLFVANRNSGDVSILDAMKLGQLGKVRVGSQPTRIISNHLGDRIYVANFGSNYLSVIDGRTGSVVTSINTGKGPVDLGITSDGTRIFVSNNTERTVTIIDAEINAPIQTTTPSQESKPYGIAIRPGGGR